MMPKYFCRTEDSFEIYPTLDEAQRAARDAMRDIRDECDDERSDEIHGVFCGIITDETRPVVCGDNNEYLDYILDPVK